MVTRIEDKNIPSSAIFLDKTVFYGEGGGQIGDRGVIVSDSSNNSRCIIEIDNVRRVKGAFIHSGLVKIGGLQSGDFVQCKVDSGSRRRSQANHTATHLLQSALKTIVDSSISQAGSLLGPIDYALTFIYLVQLY